MEVLTYRERLVLTQLVVEGRVSVSSIARRIGVTRQAAWYIIKRLREEGYVGPPMVYVRPDVVGMYYAFFQNDSPPPPDSVLRFVTLDGFNIFAVPFKTFDELEELSAIYGKPWFVPRLTPRTVTKLQKAALMKFIKNPEMSSTDLAEELSLPRTAARKLMAWVKKNVNYTYRVNLGRAGIVALAVRSQAPLGLYAPYKFFKCFAYAIGFYGVAFPDAATAAEFVRRIKAADPATEVRVIVDYELSPPPI
ncbi:MAG: winged helix-turn-helix domain-containing protein [Pyrobaculum sp.]